MTYLLGFLAAGLAFTVYKQLKKIIKMRACFEDEVLGDYFHGRLNREEELRRSVVSHLGVCEKCQEKMYELQKEG